MDTLAKLLTHIAGAPAIVFVSYRESVERVGLWLRQQGFAVEMYHGGMEQEYRERALYKFRCGAANVLVSTDLAARGLDIPEVRVVVHYHCHRRLRIIRIEMDVRRVGSQRVQFVCYLARQKLCLILLRNIRHLI